VTAPIQLRGQGNPSQGLLCASFAIKIIAKFVLLTPAIGLFHQNLAAQGFPSATLPNAVQSSAPGAAVAPASPAAPTAQGAATQSRAGGPVLLNFVNAEIEAVARAMATITGRNVLVDPRVKGTMSLSTERAVPAAVAYNQFLAALRLQGYAVVESAGLAKVVPEAEAKLQSGAVSTSTPRAASGQIVTQIFRLNHENANNLVPILRPLISPNNTINVNPGNNSLVITDYGDNLARMSRIIAALDVPSGTDVEVIKLSHSLATDVLPLLTRLTDGAVAGPGVPGQAAAGGAQRLTVLAEPRTNALILRAPSQAQLSLVRALVAQLDQPTSGGDTGNIYVVHLKNAEAVRVATTLRAALAANPASASASAGGSGGGASPIARTGAGATGGAGGAGGASQASTAPTSQAAAPSTGGNIQADPASNSLIITASEPQYRQIKAVIDMLDTRRAQVFVESLIAEVNADKAADFGIQWQGALGKDGDRNVGVLGTNFGSGGNNIIDLALAAASGGTTGARPGTGGNFGVLSNIGGTYVLGFLARFLQTNGDGNILSTPNLLTLDNEEAKIVIGQNVPFVTGQFTNTGGGNNGSVNPFQTIERKDVGLTLRVKPQISENGTIKMDIFQEVSSVDAASRNSPSGLITNKRSIESSVLVQDGGIVVLGGLLQDEFSNNQEKIPLLGDVPILGNLFRSESRSRRKTNLMVFLRPVVVRDAQATENLSLDRYDIMRLLQKDAQPKPSLALPINESPVLPPQAQPLGPTQRPRTPAPLGQPTPGNQNQQ
jgi:general secretion pathway protein D